MKFFTKVLVKYISCACIIASCIFLPVRVEAQSVAEQQALRDLAAAFPALQGLETPWSTTNASSACGQWSNLACVGGVVNQVSLTGLGFIPSSISNLVYLDTIILDGCVLTAPLPASFGTLPVAKLYLEASRFLNATTSVASIIQASCSSLTYLGLQNIDLAGASLDLSSCTLLQTVYVLSATGFSLPTFPFATSIRDITFSFISFSLPLPSFSASYSNLLKIRVQYSSVTASIPSSWALLPSLTELYVVSTPLTGTIPSGLFNIPTLTTLYLSSTNLNGSLPSVFSASLTTLDIGGGSISGTIPSSAQNLISFNAPNNLLSGTIPAFNRIRNLVLSRNQLNGTLSAALLSASTLVELDLASNRLTGTIPAVSPGSGLETLSLSGNRFTGPIPPILFSNPALKRIYLNSNFLNGTLPSVSSIVLASVLDVSNNSLTGPLPDFSGLSLTSFNARQNDFVGCPPSFATGCDLSRNPRMCRCGTSSFCLVSACVDPADRQPLRDLVAANPQLASPFLPYPWSASNSTAACSGPWTGLSCSAAGRITAISVSSRGLNGTIPQSISQLSFLISIDLSSNALRGVLPANITNVPSLLTLNVRNNQLNGTLPDFRNSSITTLSLSNNSFSGCLLARTSGISCTAIDNAGLCGCQVGVCGIPSCADLSRVDQQRSILLTIASQLPALGTLPSPWSASNNLGACSWAGITCTNGLITSISLVGYNLNGSVPAELANITTLQRLTLVNAGLTGTIPSSIFSLPLITLNVSGNSLVGQLVGEVFPPSLTIFDISGNRIIGCLLMPSSVSQCNFLKNPDLCGCSAAQCGVPSCGEQSALRKLMDDIPALKSVWNASDVSSACSWQGISCTPSGGIASIVLTGLSLNASLSSSLLNVQSNLTNLNNISITSSTLGGCLALSNLVGSSACNFSGNSDLCGCSSALCGIPSCLEVEGLRSIVASIPGVLQLPSPWVDYGRVCSWTGLVCSSAGSIVEIQLNNYALSGTIPTSIGAFQSLQTLSLENNMLVGAIPQELNMIYSLQTIRLSGNQFTAFPRASLLRMPSLRTLLLANNSLTGCFEKPLFVFSAAENCDVSGNSGYCGCSGSACQVESCPAPSSPPTIAPELDSSTASSQVVAFGAGFGVAALVLIVAAVVILLFYIRRKSRMATFATIDMSQVPDDMRTTVFGIRSSDLATEEKLGEGSFGAVWKGTYKGDIVAIKKMSYAIVGSQVAEFFREAALMLSIPSHKNIVKVFGMCQEANNFGIVLEFCAGGNLKSLLSSPSQAANLTPKSTLKLIRGIASGMAALARSNIVHRDLAARNILLSDKMEPKISDFGLSRKVDDAGVGKTSNDIGPIRWMAPEAITSLQYSEKSDVWAFGMLVYEIVTKRDPYFEYSVLDAANLVRSGQTPMIPYGTPDDIAQVMLSCWQIDPAARPTFVSLEATLESARNDRIV